MNGKRLRGEAWLEWQANYLASVLLMPRSAVKRLRNLIEPKGSRFWHLDLIQTMAGVFNVSEEAARVRLVSLNHLPIQSTTTGVHQAILKIADGLTVTKMHDCFFAAGFFFAYMLGF